MTYFMGAVLFSILIDIFWVFKYIGNWNSDETSIDNGL